MDPVILIFAIVAAFFIFKLLSALGENPGEPDKASESRKEIEALRRTLSGNRKSNDRPSTNDAEMGHDAAAMNEAETVDPKPVRPVTPALRPIADADPSFSEETFVEGAKAAYEMIVESFAKGDLKPVKPYLSADVFKAFSGAAAARAEAGHSQSLQFIGIEKARIADAAAKPDSLSITVDFVSDQVRVTRDEDGNVVDGDPNRIDLVRDRWTFSRPRKANDPNWLLVATAVAS